MEEKCKYCSDIFGRSDPINAIGFQYTGIEMKVLGALGILRCRYYSNDDHVYDAQDSIPINYCPMCGRKFE